MGDGIIRGRGENVGAHCRPEESADERLWDRCLCGDVGVGRRAVERHCVGDLEAVNGMERKESGPLQMLSATAAV